MKADEIRSSRLRSMMKHAPTVKSREELIAYAMGKFMVTRRTAEDYTDDIIEYFKQRQQK